MPSQSNQLLTAITNVVKAMKHPELMCSDGFTHNDPSIHGDYGWAGKFNFMEKDYLALGKNPNGTHWIGACVESGYEFEDVGVYQEPVECETCGDECDYTSDELEEMNKIQCEDCRNHPCCDHCGQMMYLDSAEPYCGEGCDDEDEE